MIEKFGPGSDFEKKMKELSERAEKTKTAPEEDSGRTLKEKDLPKVGADHAS